MHVLPSDVSDVLVTSGVAHLPIQSDGTWSSGGWRLTMNSSLIILSRLHDTDRETLMEQKKQQWKNPTVHNTHQEATLYVDYEQSIQTGYW